MPHAVHSRTGSAPAGPQTARLVPCSKSLWHKHRPENEDCPECDPPKAAVEPAVKEWWWCCRSTGIWSTVRLDTRFRIACAAPLYDDAKIACGCGAPAIGSGVGMCTKYTQVDHKTGVIYTTSVCRRPSVVEDPTWRKDRP